MQQRPVKAVVFDLFHTLVDYEILRPPGFKRAQKIAEVMGVKDEKAFAAWWQENERVRHVTKSRKVAEFADDYLWETAGRRCSRPQLEEIGDICGRFQDLAILNPEEDVLETLRALRGAGLKLGLLSNIDEREAAHWEDSPLAPLFDATCFSFEIGHSKPSAEAYAAVSEMLRVPAGVSVYVGDGGHDELRGARDAGFGKVVYMKGLVSRSGIRTIETMEKHQKEADSTITDLKELPMILGIHDT